jgi:DNA polymerase-3 subunit alpha
MAGYSLGKADLLRRAMGKKIREEMAKQREIFTEGSVERGVDRTRRERSSISWRNRRLWLQQVTLQHAYALVAYQTAYLKAHTSRSSWREPDPGPEQHGQGLTAHRRVHGARVAVLPPDINESSLEFVVTKKA